MAECLFHVLNRRHIDESELLPDGNINVGAGCISSGENLGECSHPQALRLHEAGPSRDFDSVLRGGAGPICCRRPNTCSGSFAMASWAAPFSMT